MTIEPIIFYKGKKFTVECAIEANGDSPSEIFFDGIDKNQRAKITSVIKRYANFGKISDRRKFKKVEGDLWEFKHYQIRVIMFHTERGHIALANGFIKKQDKIPKREIDRAKRIKSEYEKIREEMRHE